MRAGRHGPGAGSPRVDSTGAMGLIDIRELLAMLRRLGMSLRVFAFVLFLNVLCVGFEIAGIGVLLPVFELLRAGGSASIDQLQGRHWEIMRSISAHVGIPITLSLLLAISFCFVLLRQLVKYFATRYIAGVRREIANKIRQRAFSRFLLSRKSLDDPSRMGVVMSVLQAELNRALDVPFAITQSVSILVQVVSYVGALFVLSPIMSLLSIVVIALVVVLARGFLVEIRLRGRNMTKGNTQIATFMVERLKHARLIRLSGTEKAETAAFYKLSRRLSEENLRQKLVATRMELALEPVAVAMAYLMLLVGSELFGLSLERLGLFTIVLIRLVPILRSVLSQYGTIIGTLPSLEKLDQYLTETWQTRETKGGSTVFTRLDQGIYYDHVTFTYPNSKLSALDEVTVTIPAHRMSALVGPSGAGKSTMVDLLPRLRDPQSGCIRFDDTPIDEFSMDSLRTGIAFVPQDPQILNVTAAEHIRYGKENASDDEVREAARLAGALSFIKALPEGFDTLLGDGGVRLSGGQRQRLDIARALVRRAPILILDEPTSALDADAETAFRDALRTLRRETRLTIIVIAHRLSTIADADQVVVLRQGRVEAVGSHAELIPAGGWYANAIQQQHGGAAGVPSEALGAVGGSL